MTNTTGRAVRCAMYVLTHFNFQHPGLSKAYQRKFVEVYKNSDTPVSLYPARYMLMTMLPDGDTLRLYLPIFTNVPNAQQQHAWQTGSMAGKEIARLHVRRKRFSLGTDSALLRLARQYGVAEPRDLSAIRFGTMTKFFNAVQAAVYAPAGMDLFFPNTASADLNGWGEAADADYDFFFMVSLFAQSHGAAMTYDAYKVLFAKHLAAEREYATKPRNTFRMVFDMQERTTAMTLLFNNLVDGEAERARTLMHLPQTLLRDLYPTHENDPRLTPAA